MTGGLYQSAMGVEALFLIGMNKHTLYYNLCDAFTEGGCPICRLSDQSLARYLASLLYESVNDLEVRQAIRQSQGFCREHAWQLQRKGDALGIAIIHYDILTNLLRALQRSPGHGTHTTPMARLRRLLPRAVSGVPFPWTERLAPGRECPACRHRTDVQQAYLETLLQHLGDSKLATRWRTSMGLCWPHFLQSLGLVRCEADLRVLIDIESDHLERLQRELGKFIEHHDYQFGGQGFGDESDSWIRAIAKVSGGPSSL